MAASGVLINFALLEPFSNKVAVLFNRIPMVAPSDFAAVNTFLQLSMVFIADSRTNF